MSPRPLKQRFEVPGSENQLKELPTSGPSRIPGPIVRAYPHSEKVLIKNPPGAAIVRGFQVGFSSPYREDVGFLEDSARDECGHSLFEGHQQRWVAVPFLDAKRRATILNTCARRELRPCAVLFCPGGDRLFRLRNWREPVSLGIHGDECQPSRSACRMRESSVRDGGCRRRSTGGWRGRGASRQKQGRRKENRGTRRAGHGIALAPGIYSAQERPRRA